MSHHEILDSVKRASYGLMFAGGLTLFTLSLVPFATAFAGATQWTAAVPVARCGMFMALACLAFMGLRVISGKHAKDAAVLALQRREAMITLVACVAFIGGAAAAYIEPRVALFLYASVPIARLLYRAWLQRWRTATLVW